MLVSPTEPAPFHKLGKLTLVPENYGCDFLIVSAAMKIRIGVQRKQFPGDLLKSLADGRLYEQVHKMATLDMRVLIIEGHGKWTNDGTLMEMTRFTRKQLDGLIFSLHYEFGIEVYQVRDMGETYRMLQSLEEWSKKADHRSLKSRPGPAKNPWGQVTNRDYAIHVLQSFQGVGPVVAGKIFDHFGRLPMMWDVGLEEMMAVKGVGKGKAEVLMKALEQIREEGK